MTSESEPEDFTWQTLYEYIERRIADVLKALQFLREDLRLNNVGEAHTIGLERELEMLRQCSALVIEMQSREALQGICPILSLNIIRLRCRHQYADQEDSLEFAWISPIEEGRYSLAQLRMNEFHESGQRPLFEADLTQIVAEVEKLVKETCLGENQ